MTTESAGDRDAVLRDVMNQCHHCSCLRFSELVVDTTISALRARGLSRQDMGNLRAELQLHQAHITILSNDREDLREEIARLRAALEEIAKPKGMGPHRPAEVALKQIAREALNASKGTT